MIGLAWQWNGLKHQRPRAARLISIGAGVAMGALLI
jgi:hypothetical protein